MNQDVTDWWKSAFQTTIDAYYRGNLVEGLAACERLLSINGLPEGVENQIHRNLAFYTIAHASKFVPQGSVRVGSILCVSSQATTTDL